MTHDHETIAKALKYFPETGELQWLSRDGYDRQARFWNTKYAGKPAITATDNRGYKSGKLCGKYLSGHIAAVAIMTGKIPEGEVDHINGNRSDNRWENLRVVSRSENQRNKRQHVNNTSGVTGVHFDVKSRKWRAKIGNRVIGFFNEFANAALARALSVELEGGYTERHGKQIQA